MLVIMQFSRKFGYFSHFWANFNMLGIKMHVLKLRNSMMILSHIFTRSFIQFQAIFMQFWLFQSILGQFQHVWYQNAGTLAEKFNGDTFMHFLRTPSRNFTHFGYFSHFWANFNMLGIKMHVLELRNSIAILSRTFIHSLTQFHTIFTQFWLFLPFFGKL